MVENSAVAEILQRLFQTPPAEFVAERNSVVKALKSDGDKELAATVAAVRRPGMSDWLLNVGAVEHSDDVAELVEAANEVIDSQEAAMEGRDTGDLRIRLKLLRVCTATVATLASGIAERFEQTGAGSSATDITTRLTEIAGNRGALALLERGLLGAEDPGSADPFAALGGAPAPPRAKKAEPAKAAKAKPEPARKAEKPIGPTAAERKERRAAVAAAQKALAAAESIADAALRAVSKQETVLAKAEARVTEAEAQLEALKEAASTAADALEAARADHDSAAADVDAATSSLEAAERAVDQ